MRRKYYTIIYGVKSRECYEYANEFYAKRMAEIHNSQIGGIALVFCITFGAQRITRQLIPTTEGI